MAAAWKVNEAFGSRANADDVERRSNSAAARAQKLSHVNKNRCESRRVWRLRAVALSRHA